MVTIEEETQAKEFLKRAEIRTMKKDLSALREFDALKERDKIVKIKTLEEQKAEQAKKMEIPTPPKPDVTDVLQKGISEERIAEKELKNYANEQERQQIFMLESQRLSLRKQVDVIDKEKDPDLKLKKNQLLIQKRNQQEKLNLILEEERKQETEQKFIADKEQKTTIPLEKKTLEQTRAEIEQKIQETEKRRWEAEKAIQETDTQVSQLDKSLELLVIEKNGLNDKILGIDKSLRDVYSIVINREEDKRKGLAREEVIRKEAISKATAQRNEQIQRQQWSGKPNIENNNLINNIPIPTKNNIKNTYKKEEEQREKFLKDIDEAMGDDKK